jgi:arylsulfatase A-like enzyme
MYLTYTIPHKGYTVPAVSRQQYESQDWPKVKGKPGHYEYDPEVNSAFAGMVSHMDAGIGQVRAKLKEKGIDKNTLVFFTSDNGHEYFGDLFNSAGEFSGKKRSVTEGGIRMPTVVVWPGNVQAASKISTPLAFWDVLPTFCEIGGIKTSVQTDGLSFVPALTGRLTEQKQHKVLYWEFNESKGPMQAIRFGNWKAIRYWDKKTKQMGRIQLYDLSQDKGEKKNLASKNPEKTQQALKLFLASRTEHPEFPLAPIERKMKGKKKKKK